MRNNYLIVGGIAALLSAFVHTIAGEMTLVDALHSSNMDLQSRTEWLGLWHMVTGLLFAMGFVTLKSGVRYKSEDRSLLQFVLVMCILTILAFVGSSMYQSAHAPQYVFFIVIGLFVFLGLRKSQAPNPS